MSDTQWRGICSAMVPPNVSTQFNFCPPTSPVTAPRHSSLHSSQRWASRLVLRYSHCRRQRWCTGVRHAQGRMRLPPAACRAAGKDERWELGALWREGNGSGGGHARESPRHAWASDRHSITAVKTEVHCQGVENAFFRSEHLLARNPPSHPLPHPPLAGSSDTDRLLLGVLQTWTAFRSGLASGHGEAVALNALLEK